MPGLTHRMLAARHLKVWCFVAAAALGGCQTASTQPSPDNGSARLAAARTARLQQRPGFTLNGRIASSASPIAASLLWEQTADATYLRLAGPFGAGATVLAQQGSGWRVQRGADSYWVDDADGAVAQILGFELPLSSLRYWVQGVPNPQEPATPGEWDSAGRMRAFHQQGWALRFDEYADAAELPGRVEAVRDDWQAVVTIKQWSEAPTANAP